MSNPICNDPVIEDELQSSLNELEECLYQMKPEERVKVFEHLKSKFCMNCGYDNKELKYSPCYCDRDRF